MKKNSARKFFACFTLLMFLANIAAAGTLKLDESKINNDVIEQGNATYRILEDDNVFVLFMAGGFAEYRRIIVENTTKTKKMENEKNMLNENLQNLMGKKDRLNNESVGLAESIQNSKAILAGIAQDVEKIKKMIADLKGRESEYKNKITGKILVDPASFRMAVVVFIILIVVVLVMKGRNLIGVNGRTAAAPSPPLQSFVAPQPAVVRPTIITVKTEQPKPEARPENADEPLI